MVKLDNRHDFIEYAYSKEIVKDFPKLLSIYSKLIVVLNEYRQYTVADEVYQSVLDNISILEIQLAYYQRVYDQKGKMPNKERLKDE